MHIHPLQMKCLTLGEIFKSQINFIQKKLTNDTSSKLPRANSNDCQYLPYTDQLPSFSKNHNNLSFGCLLTRILLKAKTSSGRKNWFSFAKSHSRSSAAPWLKNQWRSKLLDRREEAVVCWDDDLGDTTGMTGRGNWDRWASGCRVGWKCSLSRW